MARKGNHQEALQAYEQASGIQEQLLATQPYSPTLTGDVAYALGLQGSSARKLGKMDLAISCYSKSYGIMKKLHDEAPDELGRLLDLAYAESKMAIAYISMKSPEYDAMASSWLSQAESRFVECKRHNKAMQRLFTLDQLAYEITFNKGLLERRIAKRNAGP